MGGSLGTDGHVWTSADVWAAIHGNDKREAKLRFDNITTRRGEEFDHRQYREVGFVVALMHRDAVLALDCLQWLEERQVDAAWQREQLTWGTQAHLRTWVYRSYTPGEAVPVLEALSERVGTIAEQAEVQQFLAEAKRREANEYHWCLPFRRHTRATQQRLRDEAERHQAAADRLRLLHGEK